MRFLNLAVVAGAAVVMFADYLREKRRLATMRALPPDRARTLFDLGQRQRERVMLLGAVVLAAAAVASLVALASAGRWRA